MLKNTGARKLLGYPVCNRNLCRCSNVVTKVTKFSRRRGYLVIFPTSSESPLPSSFFFKMTDLDLEDSSRQSISRSCAPVALRLKFFPDKSNFLILFGIIVGARSPATAPGQFSELRSEERGVPILWFNSRVPHHHAKVLILRKPHWSPWVHFIFGEALSRTYLTVLESSDY